MKANKWDTSNRPSMQELIPEGKYAGIIFSIVDLWTQDVTYEGETKQQRKVHITWELPKIMLTFNEEKGEQPAVISKKYTFSMHPKSALRSLVENIEWKMEDNDAYAYELQNILGKYCLLKIEHNKQYVNIANIMWMDTEEELEQVEKGIKPINEHRLFDLDEPNEKTLETMPEWMKEIIISSPEYDKRQTEGDLEF